MTDIRVYGISHVIPFGSEHEASLAELIVVDAETGASTSVGVTDEGARILLEFIDQLSGRDAGEHGDPDVGGGDLPKQGAAKKNMERGGYPSGADTEVGVESEIGDQI